MAGAVSGRDVLPLPCSPLPALATVALVWSVGRAPLSAVPDELAEPDRYPESLGRSRREGTAGNLAAILRGIFWMALGDGFWLCVFPMMV